MVGVPRLMRASRRTLLASAACAVWMAVVPLAHAQTSSFSADATASGLGGDYLSTGGSGQSAASATSPGGLYGVAPGTAVGSADLSTGLLKVLAKSQRGVGRGNSAAWANFSDKVTLTPPADFSGATIPVTLKLSTSATVTGSDDA